MGHSIKRVDYLPRDRRNFHVASHFGFGSIGVASIEYPLNFGNFFESHEQSKLSRELEILTCTSLNDNDSVLRVESLIEKVATPKNVIY